MLNAQLTPANTCGVGYDEVISKLEVLRGLDTDFCLGTCPGPSGRSSRMSEVSGAVP